MQKTFPPTHKSTVLDEYLTSTHQEHYSSSEINNFETVKIENHLSSESITNGMSFKTVIELSNVQNCAG